MKQTILILISVIYLSACTTDEKMECVDISYNKPFSAVVGKQYCIDDQNFITIESIKNELCPCDAICIWEGEFILNFSGKSSGKNFIYSYGSSVNTPDIQPYNDFKIKLKSISPDECDFEVQNEFKVELLLEK